jgi:hypothetical protein
MGIFLVQFKMLCKEFNHCTDEYGTEVKNYHSQCDVGIRNA